MKASPENIWQAPAYLPYLQPPLSDAAITDAEAKIGFRLPEAYLALLRVQNGGYIRYGLPELLHDQICGIGPHFPSLTKFNWDDCRDYVSYELDGLVPFDGDGHWHLCLDYRRDADSPAVTYADIECNRESALAPSFSEYLALLEIEACDTDFVLLGIRDIEEAKCALAGKLGVQFYAPDSYGHGYPTHRASGKAGGSSGSIWISPNLVPRGFVREDDTRFEELRSILPGEARRYPELPATSFLLTMTDGLRSYVLRACKDLAIEIHPLSEYLV